jgi:hypothetical protein
VLHGLALVDVKAIEVCRQVYDAMQTFGGVQRGTSSKQLAGAGDGEGLAPFRQVACRVVVNPDVIGASDLASVEAK